MNTHRSRLRPLNIPPRKDVDFSPSPSVIGGTLSPDLSPNTPPTFPQQDSPLCPRVSKIANYLLLDVLDSTGNIQIYHAVHTTTEREFICKVIPLEKYRDTLGAYWQIGSHDHINEIEEVILGESKAYVFFARNYGDLHSYVRNKRKLKESEVLQLFGQIVSAIAHCHQNGVVLRDLKLRKFVFKDAERTELKLEGLEDACVLPDEDNDNLSDKHGCPAYVSPEILNTIDSYSGKAADIWSIGVMLYTMLIGRYPFHDTEAGALFTKIRRGHYSIPDTISSRAKCLIKNLLRRDPAERLRAEDIPNHPWFSHTPRLSGHTKVDRDRDTDQMVPQFSPPQDVQGESLFL